MKIGVRDILSPFAEKSSWRYRRVPPPASPVCFLWNRLSHLVAPGWTKTAETCPTTEENSAKDKKFVKSVFASVVHLYGGSARGATRDKCSKNRGDDRETRRSTKQTRLASLFNRNLVKLRRCKVFFSWINLSNVKNRCQKTFHNVTSLSISKHQKDEFDSFPENLTRFIYTGLATFMILIMI